MVGGASGRQLQCSEEFAARADFTCRSCAGAEGEDPLRAERWDRESPVDNGLGSAAASRSSDQSEDEALHGP